MFFGNGLPVESLKGAMNTMAFAECFDGQIPSPSKFSRLARMANIAKRKAEFTHKEFRRYGIDDQGGIFVLHEPLMPNHLARVKTNDCALPQISWHGTVSAMENQSKPFDDIAERIRWHRALVGLEQKEYAEKAGLKRSQLSNWESGDYRLSLDGARALRLTYGLSLDFMFEGIDDALSMSLRAAWRDRP